ncbi:MAG: DUF523 domain-containing protein [Desulfobacter sp.]|nr:MAG: DUF523 domain-containing protein [Desulfobacter sp.]
MEKILISACLLGEPVRYDGVSKPVAHPMIHEWQRQGRLVPFCPETAGGLPIPRPPAEICGGGGTDVLADAARVVTRGADVTAPFLMGARAALALAGEKGICFALLKERSPSCGSNRIYDGHFTGTLIPGMGVTTALLRRHGISVFSENEIDDLAKRIK